MEIDPVFNEDSEDLEEDITDLDTYIQKKKLFSINSDFIEAPQYENKSGTFTTGINIFTKDEQKKMEKRARRFGLTHTSNSIDVENEEHLYSSMGILDDHENAKYIRLNVLHMRGTDDMSTQDVFNYFKDYAPASIEWINDVSCNVVWLDKISAARALIGMSKKIIGLNDKDETLKLQSEENSLDNDNKLIDVEENNYIGENNCIEAVKNTINFKDINFPLPPGVWRKGIDCEKSKKILLRFAISSDKKQQNSERLSEYYKKYGNPNFGGMRGILTDSKKKMYKDIRSKRKLTHRAAENDNINAKNPWGSLSETWGTNDSVEEDFIKQPHLKNYQEIAVEPRGIKRRLGFKPQNKEADEELKDSEGSSSDSDDEWNKRSKVLRMRMHADDEEEKVQKKKLKQLSKRVHEKTFDRDLRSRLGRSNPVTYREPIKVTVTNIPQRLRKPIKLKDEDKVEEDRNIPEIVHDHDEEKEEGEWEEDEEEVENNRNDSNQEGPTEEEEEEEEEGGGEESESGSESESNSDSDVSEKEVQGPKGSVIKVVQRAKPRVASTVWARLNNDAENTFTQERKNLKSTISVDLRSRLGYHNRGRSPLRIEVRNDKYTKRNSDSE